MPAIIKAYDGYVPQIGDEVFLADGAVVVGHVELRNRANVWYGAVIRGDMGPIVIGEGASIQDLACLHMKRGGPGLEIGAYVSVGHGTIIHGAKVHDGVFIGNGAIIMDDAELGEQCVVAAGALVPRGMKVPPRVLVRGRPAKVIRDLSPEEQGFGRREAASQGEMAKKSEP